MKLVRSHAASSNALASGPQAVPGVNQAFATTQAAYRFFHNPRISLRALAAPLIAFSRQEAASVCQRYVLVAHDWTPLSYIKHAGKKDRVMFSQCRKPEGYEVQSALALSDHDGSPLAPLVVSLRAVDGVHCSRSSQVRKALSPLDELDPAMTYIERLKLPLPVVHLVDAEADSVAHFREWSLRPGRWFLVRGDDRLVEYQGREQRCSAIQSELRDAGNFTVSREVLYHGKPAQQHVAEVPVRLLRAGQRNRPKAGDRQRIVGPPLALRLTYCRGSFPPRRTTGDLVLARPPATRGQHRNRGPMVLLALENRRILQASEIGRHAGRAMATGIGGRHHASLARGRHGLCCRLASGT